MPPVSVENMELEVMSCHRVKTAQPFSLALD